jgi:P27 family predicted phage terminase small subunit
MRGRRPKPTALKKLEGNPGHRRLNEEEPAPAALAPPCPPFIQGAAREHWDEVAPQLEAMGVLARIDGPMLAAYCEAYAQWRRATDGLAKLGDIIKYPNGIPTLSPYFAIQRRAISTMLRLATEFGMTPSSRSRLRVERPAVENPLQEFMKRAPSNRPPLVQ